MPIQDRYLNVFHSLHSARLGVHVLLSRKIASYSCSRLCIVSLLPWFPTSKADVQHVIEALHWFCEKEGIYACVLITRNFCSNQFADPFHGWFLRAIRQELLESSDNLGHGRRDPRLSHAFFSCIQSTGPPAHLSFTNFLFSVFWSNFSFWVFVSCISLTLHVFCLFKLHFDETTTVMATTGGEILSAVSKKTILRVSVNAYFLNGEVNWKG